MNESYFGQLKAGEQAIGRWLMSGTAAAHGLPPQAGVVFAPALTGLAKAKAEGTLPVLPSALAKQGRFRGWTIEDSLDVAFYTERYFGKYSRLPSAAALDFSTLWTMHTHLRRADKRLATRATPRFLVMSDEPGSGKSTVLRILLRLCPYTYGLDTEPTSEGLILTISKEFATVLIDEGDILLGSGMRKAAVRAIINAGYSPEGTTLRERRGEPDRPKVFAPMAIASLDIVERRGGSENLAALWSRCAPKIRMHQSTEAIPELDDEADDAAVILQSRLTEWAQANADVAKGQPDMRFLTGREAEIMRPLAAIAESLKGDDWEERFWDGAEELHQVGFFDQHADMGPLAEMFGKRG